MRSEYIAKARQAPILDVIDKDTDLTYIAKTRDCGKEYAGTCPFCGGEDRFRVQPETNSWWCRHCSEQWDGPIGYVIRRDKVDFKQAVIWLHNTFSLLDRGGCGGVPPTDIHQAIEHLPPSIAWQTKQREASAFQQRILWLIWGKQALAHLHSRGLVDSTIRQARLGFNPTLNCITIPHEVNGQLWQVKQRFLTGTGAKYKLVKGSVQGAPYLADWLSDKSLVVIVEGELDALLLWQECHDLCDVLTLGSANVKLAEGFLPLFGDSRTSYAIATDNDTMGDRSADYWLALLGKRAFRAVPVIGKDITEMASEIDLRWWVRELIKEL